SSGAADGCLVPGCDRRSFPASEAVGKSSALMSFMSLHFGWQRRHNPVRGWTLIELLVVVSVLTVLVALFIPVGRSISAGGLQAKCLNNLRTFGNGIILYAAD